MENEPEKIPTRQKILECAIDLFAMKGFTETTVRELAAAAGVKEASLYNHFPSKNAILEYILEEYSSFSHTAFEKDKLSLIKENPSADVILSSMALAFPKGREEHFLKELYVILHEQHRNPLVAKLVTEEYILGNEQLVKSMIQHLKDLGVLKEDTDPDYWAKMHSCVLYTFASRLLLGIGDSSPGFTGLSMVDVLRETYDLMLKTCGVCTSV